MGLFAFTHWIWILGSALTRTCDELQFSFPLFSILSILFQLYVNRSFNDVWLGVTSRFPFCCVAPPLEFCPLISFALHVFHTGCSGSSCGYPCFLPFTYDTNCFDSPFNIILHSGRRSCMLHVPEFMPSHCPSNLFLWAFYLYSSPSESNCISVDTILVSLQLRVA